MATNETARGARTRTARGVVYPIAGAMLVTLPVALVLLSRTYCLFDKPNASTRTLLIAVCWSLVLVGIAGTGMASRGVRWGWLILFGLQPVWIAYALATAQHGLVAASLAYGAVQLNGFLRTTAGTVRAIPTVANARRR